MAKSNHYSPRISRFLVSVLYHEAKARKIPMTKLTDEILQQTLPTPSIGCRPEHSDGRFHARSHIRNEGQRNQQRRSQAQVQYSRLELHTRSKRVYPAHRE